MKLKFIFIVLTLICSFSKANNYYVSSKTGVDSNAGTISFPWKTLVKVNSFILSPGDSVFFKRNESFRGQLIPQNGDVSNVIYYGAYGQGRLPSLMGSVDASGVLDWNDEGGNIWCTTKSCSTDIGNVIFNNSDSVGVKKWSVENLVNQNDFLYDRSLEKLKMYSTDNPAVHYANIELAVRKHIVNFENTSYVSFENLNIKYGAAHGFGGGNTNDITITSCEISFVGGGDLHQDNRTVRFGNGIEFWGNASNNKVERCKIWEIYDTGLSNQNHTVATAQRNIKYQNNIIWNCGLASFEYWNRPSSSRTTGIYFEHNTCINAGFGWGEQRLDYSGIHVLLDENTAQTDSLFIRNNIFYIAKRFTYAAESGIKNFVDLDYNLVYQREQFDSLFVAYSSGNVDQQFHLNEFSVFTSALNKDQNSLVGDPLFIDQTNNNFMVLNNSPCINNGGVVDVLNDFHNNGRPRQSISDIGAYEYSIPVGQEVISKNVDVFPNPTSGVVNIECENMISVSLFSSRGVLMHRKEEVRSDSCSFLLDAPSGVYFLKITSPVRELFIKLVKI